MSDLKVRATEEVWRERSQIGTACKCGAHSNQAWGDGGAEWLIDHVKAAHPDAIDWKGSIVEALTHPDDELRAILMVLVGQEPPAAPAPTVDTARTNGQPVLQVVGPEGTGSATWVVPNA